MDLRCSTISILCRAVKGAPVLILFYFSRCSPELGAYPVHEGERCLDLNINASAPHLHLTGKRTVEEEKDVAGGGLVSK